MNVDRADEYISRGPCILDSSNPFVPLVFKNLRVIEDPVDFENDLDDPRKLISRDRLVIKGEHGRISRRFPRIFVDVDLSDKQVLNKTVADNFEMAKSLFPRQSDIAERLLQVSKEETVVLVVIDGLSYHDARRVFACEPMIVDGATITQDGIQRIVGNPTIAQRMYQRGTRNLYGFSYWSREEEPDITGKSFSPIPEENFLRYESFDQVIEKLKEIDPPQSYIQIFVAGLDEICHRHRDSPPPLDSLLKQIGKKVSAVQKVLERKKTRGMIFATSDHGILWKEGNDLKILDDPQFKEGVRYCTGKIIRDTAIASPDGKSSVTCLKYPYISKAIKRNEWGVHGGISYEESIVPWISLVVD